MNSRTITKSTRNGFRLRPDVAGPHRHGHAHRACDGPSRRSELLSPAPNRPHPNRASHKADSIRDQLDKTVASIRTLNDTIEYEFGIDRRQHEHIGETILRAALTRSLSSGTSSRPCTASWTATSLPTRAVATALHAGRCMEAMAESMAHKTDFATIQPKALIDHSLLTHPR
jgi:hypothetical protein